MKLIIREPDKGYLDRWLWVPKREVSASQIRGVLLYKQSNTKFIQAWRETPTHFLVPRNYVRDEVRERLNYELVDARFTAFPRINIKSSVVLDSQSPDHRYQKDSVEALQGTYDGILCLRCGGGKSPIALHAAAALKTPILIVVDEKGLAQQWKQAINMFITTGDPVIGMVGAGKFDWKHDITIATVQSLARAAKLGNITPDMARHFGVVIYDEVQVIGAPSFNTVVGEFHGRRWGLSATPQREDQYDSLLSFSLGRVIYTYLMPETKPHFYFYRLPTPPLSTSDRKQALNSVGKFHFTRAFGILAANTKRTALIVHEIKLALSRGRNILVLSHSRKMCEALAAALPGSGLVHGGISGKLRLSRIANHNPIVAIMRVGAKALDKKALDTVFIVDPLAKVGNVQQVMGRALRLSPNKNHPVVIAFDDANIRELHMLCNKMRRTLARWPDEQGGAIGFATISPGHENKKDRKK